MALFNCPECGKEISDKAETCPNCGLRFYQKQPVAVPRPPVSSAQDEAVPAEEKKARRKKSPFKILRSTAASAGGQTASVEDEAAPAGDEKKKEKKTAPRWLVPLAAAAGLLLAALAVAALLLTGVLRTGDAQIEGPGFDSPEDAIRAYAEAMKEGDLDAMIACFAVESYVNRYDPRAYYERVEAFNSSYPLSGSVIPDSTELLQQLRVKARVSAIADVVWGQLMAVAVPEEYYNDMWMLRDETQLRDFWRAWKHTAKLESMKPGKVLSDKKLLDEDYDRERVDKMYERIEEMYGVSAVRLVGMELTVDGDEYLLVLLAARYGERWYLLGRDFLGLYPELGRWSLMRC